MEQAVYSWAIIHWLSDKYEYEYVRIAPQIIPLGATEQMVYAFSIATRLFIRTFSVAVGIKLISINTRVCK